MPNAPAPPLRKGLLPALRQSLIQMGQFSVHGRWGTKRGLAGLGSRIALTTDLQTVLNDSRQLDASDARHSITQVATKLCRRQGSDPTLHHTPAGQAVHPEQSQSVLSLMPARRLAARPPAPCQSAMTGPCHQLLGERCAQQPTWASVRGSLSALLSHRTEMSCSQGQECRECSQRAA